MAKTDKNIKKAMTAEGKNPPGRPPLGKPQDAQGHAVEGGGHRIVYNPGVRGGHWYRDKNGFVQYGTLSPGGRYAPVGVGKPLETRASGKVPRGPYAGFEAIRSIRALLTVADLTHYGLSNVVTMSNLLSDEVRQELNLGNNKESLQKIIDTHHLPTGGALLTGIIASKMGVPVRHIADYAEAFATAEKLGVDVEDLIGRIIDNERRLPDGSFPVDHENTKEALIGHIMDAYPSVADDLDVRIAAAQAAQAAVAYQHISAQRIERLNTRAEQLKLVFHPTADVHERFIKFLVAARELGIIGFVRELDDVPAKLRPDGTVVPLNEQMASLGKMYINTHGIEWLVRQVNNLAGTPQSNRTLAEMLPVLLRYASWRRAKESGSEGDAQVAWFSTPDGEAKQDFVAKFAPGSDQFERWKQDASGFWQAPGWKTDIDGLVTQDGNCGVAVIKHLLAESDPALHTREFVTDYFKHLNTEGAKFAELLESFNNSDTSTLGYHIVEAVAANKISFADGFDTEAVSKILKDLTARRDKYTAAINARTVNPAYVESILPESIIKNFKAINKKLFDYQLRAAFFHFVAGRSLNGFDVGTGKTYIAGVWSALVRKYGSAKITVHVVPKTTIDQYPTEMRKALGPEEFTYASIATRDIAAHGLTMEEALATLEGIRDADAPPVNHIVLSNSWLDGGRELEELKRLSGLSVYNEQNMLVRNPALTDEEYEGRMRTLIPQLRIVQLLKEVHEKHGLSYVIDEAHSPDSGLRNPNNIAYKVVDELLRGVPHVLGMTANAAANSIKDFFTVLNILAPGEVPQAVRDLEHQTATIEQYPEADTDGNHTGKMLSRFNNLEPFRVAAKETMHVYLQRYVHDEEAQRALASQGLAPPVANLNTHLAPQTPLMTDYLTTAEEGHDDYARLDMRDIRNRRNIKQYRNKLARYNSMYADTTAFPDEALWGLRSVVIVRKDAEGNILINPVTNKPLTEEKLIVDDYRLKPPKKDNPLTWADVQDKPALRGLYIHNLCKKVRLDPALVYGRHMPKEHQGVVGGKVDVALDLIKKHLNSPVTNHGAVILTFESVQAMRVLRSRMEEEGIPSSLVIEFRGDGDSVVLDRRLAADRDIGAREVNKGNVKVALMSTRLAVGLNLQNAPRLIMVEEPSTVHHMDQTQGRVNRVGGPGTNEITIVRLNTAADFRALQRRAARALQVVPFLQHDEALATMSAHDAQVHHIKEGLRRLGVPYEPGYEDEMQPAPDKVALAQLADRLGYGGSVLDLSRFEQTVAESQHYQRTVTAPTFWAQRFVATGIDQIKQKRNANQIMYSKGKRSEEDYKTVNAELDRYEALWLAASAALNKEEAVMPTGSRPSVAMYGAFALNEPINPFAQFAAQVTTPDSRLKRILNVRLTDYPDAVITDSDVPGADDVFIHYYMWNAVENNDVQDVSELVDGVLRPIAEAAGLWNDDYRTRLYVKIVNMLHTWEQEGLISWDGTVPSRMPFTGPTLGRVTPIRAAPTPPALPAEESLLRIVASVADKDPANLDSLRGSPVFGDALTKLRLEAKPPDIFDLMPTASDEPAFKPLKVWNGREVITVLPHQLQELWTNLRNHIASGKTVASPQDAHIAMVGKPYDNPKDEYATKVILHQFELMNLVAPRSLQVPRGVKLTPRAGYLLPDWSDGVPVGDGTQALTAEAVTDYWLQTYNYLQSGGAISSPQDLAQVLELPPEYEYWTYDLIDEFKRQRLIYRGQL